MNIKDLALVALVVIVCLVAYHKGISPLLDKKNTPAEQQGVFFYLSNANALYFLVVVPSRLIIYSNANLLKIEKSPPLKKPLLTQSATPTHTVEHSCKFGYNEKIKFIKGFTKWRNHPKVVAKRNTQAQIKWEKAKKYFKQKIKK